MSLGLGTWARAATHHARAERAADSCVCAVAPGSLWLRVGLGVRRGCGVSVDHRVREKIWNVEILSLAEVENGLRY